MNIIFGYSRCKYLTVPVTDSFSKMMRLHKVFYSVRRHVASPLQYVVAMVKLYTAAFLRQLDLEFFERAFVLLGTSPKLERDQSETNIVVVPSSFIQVSNFSKDPKWFQSHQLTTILVDLIED